MVVVVAGAAQSHGQGHQQRRQEGRQAQHTAAALAVEDAQLGRRVQAHETQTGERDWEKTIFGERACSVCGVSIKIGSPFQ